MKTISICDVETSGLDPVDHEIIEIGLVVFEAEAPFKIISTFNSKVRPEHPETGSSRAYEVNGYEEDEWKDAPSLKEVLLDIEKIDGVVGSNLAAYNVSFDYGFIQAAYKKAEMKEPFQHLRLDMFSLAWARIPQDKLRYWRLKSVCEYLKVPPEPEIHRAINGAQAAYEVYCKLMGDGFTVSEQSTLSL